MLAALSPAEISFVVRRLAATRPHLAAVAIVAAPDDLVRLCREELTGVDVRVGGWDIRGRWFGVVVVAPVGQGRAARRASVEWRVVAQHLKPAP